MTGDDGAHYRSSVDGVVVKNMKINSCGGEGVRLRYFVTNCTLFHNRITSTGCFDFKFDGDQGIKNGEGICEYFVTLVFFVFGLGGGKLSIVQSACVNKFDLESVIVACLALGVVSSRGCHNLVLFYSILTFF